MMSMKFIIKATSIFIFVLISGTIHAQRIKATATIDSTNILLGDQVKLFLEIDHPKNIKVIFPNVPNMILENIEVLKRFDPDTFEIENENYQKQIQSFLITSFDSGSYQIPPFWFKIDLNNRIDSVPTNVVTLNVYSLPIDTTRGPTDIKMPYDAPLTLKEVTPYILGVILIAAILFFIFYAIRRRRNNQPVFVLPRKPKEPAHIIALRELNRIKKEKLWQQGKTKQFYSEVTEALRRYIEDRFKIPAMEQTSVETLESFRLQPDLLKNKTYDYLHMILNTADLVKFAKYQTLPDDDNLTLVNAYFFVDDTKIEKKPDAPKNSEEENGEEVEIK
jgi:hypothetical protein